MTRAKPTVNGEMDALIKQIVRALERIGFGDAVRGKPDFGAIEGLTIKVTDALHEIELQLTRIADALEREET